MNSLIHWRKSNKRLEGEVVTVLVEGPSAKREDIYAGYTRTNKQVLFRGRIRKKI